MYKIIITDKNNKQVYKLENIDCADSFKKRLMGLMLKKKFNGLIFKQKNPNRYFGSIHTCFMKVPIKIIYINNNMTIHEIVSLTPWKLYIPQKENIKYIIELPIKNHRIDYVKIGEKIVIENEDKKN